MPRARSVLTDCMEAYRRATASIYKHGYDNPRELSGVKSSPDSLNPQIPNARVWPNLGAPVANEVFGSCSRMATASTML